MTPQDQHNNEMGRAAAAAFEQHYQETIDICSELLTSGVYEKLEADDQESARRCRAEARLMMATAMHYADGHYEDIVRVLSFAMDAPTEIQKDVYFTMAVVQLSFGHQKEAQDSMQQSLLLIEAARKGSTPDPDGALAMQEDEARQFLREIAPGA